MTQTTTTTAKTETTAPASGTQQGPSRTGRLASGLRAAGYAAQVASLQPGIVGVGGRIAGAGIGLASSLLDRTSTPGADTTQPTAEAEPEAEAAAPEVRVEVTAGTLNVRSAPEVTRDNQVGQLQRTDVVVVVAPAGDWLEIQYGEGTGFISAQYTRPAAATQPVTEAPGGPIDAAASNTRYGATVDTLVSDYQTVPVWRSDQSEDEAPAATFRTPYVLNSPESVQTALSSQRSTHSGLATRAGSTVGTATGNRPFVGKGTPTEVQLVAQAAIDAGLTNPGGIQAYINNGPMNSSGSRQNGRWGVDCSGFTAIVVSEMAGNGRDVSGNRRSTSYRPGGGALTGGGFTQVAADRAQAGDVVSYMSTNHVVVIAERQDVNIVNAEGETKAAVKLRVGESGGAGIRSTNTFWFVPGAARYGNTTPRTSPDVTLARRNATTAPTWEDYRDGFRVITTGFNVSNYSIVRPPANPELRAAPGEEAQATQSDGQQDSTQAGPQ